MTVLSQENINAATGFLQPGATLGQAIETSGTPDLFKVWGFRSDDFITDGVAEEDVVAGDWIRASALSELNFDSGRFAVRAGFTDDNNNGVFSSEFAMGHIARGSATSLAWDVGSSFFANVSKTLDDVVDTSGLRPVDSVQVVVRRDGTNVAETGGFVGADELANTSFNTGSAATDTEVFVDTFVSGQGRSGWASAEFTPVSPVTAELPRLDLAVNGSDIAINALDALDDPSDFGFTASVQASADNTGLDVSGDNTITPQPETNGPLTRKLEITDWDGKSVVSTGVVGLGTTGNDATGLTGGAADDVIFGFDGADTLTGGEGGDDLVGGSGSDAFVYGAQTDSNVDGGVTGLDHITDFDAADDDEVIDLTAIGTGAIHSVSDSGEGRLDASSLASDIANRVDDDFNSLGTGDLDVAIFSGNSGDLDGTTHIAVDANDSGAFEAANDLVIQVTGLHGSRADFTEADLA